MCSEERTYARNKTRCKRDVTFRDINLQFRILMCVFHVTRYTLRVTGYAFIARELEESFERSPIPETTLADAGARERNSSGIESSMSSFPGMLNWTLNGDVT